MEHYVGLDVSLKLTAICIVDRTGKIQREGVVHSDPEAIAAFIKSNAPHVARIGLETGATSTWLWTELNRLGLPVICIDARHAKAALKMQFKEAVPEMSRVAVLWNPNHADPEFRETKRVAATKGIDVQSLEVRKVSDFDQAFSATTDQGAEGLIVVSTRLLLAQRQRILAFAKNSKIPTIGNWGDWARDGLLLSYGPNTDEAMRRVAVYVDKILKGAQPAELPIERPTRFELVVNLRTAKAIGLTVSPTLLARADAIID
jgi:hypothetical protein